MKPHTLLLSLFATFALFSLAPARAQNLGELLEEVELGAIIGTWVDEDTKGEAVTVTYSWRIENHALALSVKSPNGNSEALIAVDPANGEILHLSVDDKGRMTKGKWSEEGGLAVLDIARVDADGETVELQITHKLVDNSDLVVGMTNADTGEGGEFTLVRKPE